MASVFVCGTQFGLDHDLMSYTLPVHVASQLSWFGKSGPWVMNPIPRGLQGENGKRYFVKTEIHMFTSWNIKLKFGSNHVQLLLSTDEDFMNLLFNVIDLINSFL